MITTEELQQRGYRRFDWQSCWPVLADARWQKTVRTASGTTAYVLNIYEYQDDAISQHRVWRGAGWQPEVQCYLDAERQHVVKLTLVGLDHVAAFEAWVAQAYVALTAVPREWA